MNQQHCQSVTDTVKVLSPSKEQKNEGKWECDLENTMKVHCFGSEWERMLNVDGKYEGVIFSSASFLWYGLRALFGL